LWLIHPVRCPLHFVTAASAPMAPAALCFYGMHGADGRERDKILLLLSSVACGREGLSLRA